MAKPAAAPAAAFSHFHASAAASEAPGGGISGEGWPLHLRLLLRASVDSGAAAAARLLRARAGVRG